MLTSLVKYCGYFRLQTLKKINIVHYGNITCLCNRKNNMSTCTLSLSGHKYKYKNIIWHQFKGRSVHNITLVVQASWDKVFLHKSNSIPDVKFLDHLIGWLLTNAGKVTLKLNLSQLKHHPEVRDAMLAPVSYCEVQPKCISTYIHTLVTITHLQAPTRCSYRQQGTKGESPSIITM